ncbi:exonuclease domain-containing protein [Nocardia sp. NPDC058176]|uniref:exonuclease domain-containing protein n=1 Tax=Nocardia sp. NPDC058176 TaxID=3346368 RepID=UPI0036DE6275
MRGQFVHNGYSRPIGFHPSTYFATGTAEILRGAPEFVQVCAQLSGLLAGRMLVAHNALFDYGFLAREFARTGTRLPVDRRMCTLALARRVAPPTPDYKLGTLASYYGVPQHKAHDALDDTRVLAQVLRAMVADANWSHAPRRPGSM